MQDYQTNSKQIQNKFKRICRSQMSIRTLNTRTQGSPAGAGSWNQFARPGYPVVQTLTRNTTVQFDIDLETTARANVPRLLL